MTLDPAAVGSDKPATDGGPAFEKFIPIGAGTFSSDMIKVIRRLPDEQPEVFGG
jgi:hypothetical protein